MTGLDLSQTEFVRPDFFSDIDLEPLLVAVPSEATCKGMFLSDIVEGVRRKLPGREQELLSRVDREKYLAFGDYPLREHVLLTALAAKLLYPNVPSREGARRIGQAVFPAFSESMIGRVIFGVLGNDLDRIFEVAPRAYQRTLSHGRITADFVGPRHWRYRFDGYFSHLDTFQVGVIEGPILAAGKTPHVRVRTRSLFLGELDIHWT